MKVTRTRGPADSIEEAASASQFVIVSTLRSLGLRARVALLAVVVCALPRTSARVLAEPPSAVEAAYHRLLGVLAADGSPDATLGELEGFDGSALWALRGRIAAAERAYRRGDEPTARTLIAGAKPDETTPDYLRSYLHYMRGLLEPDLAMHHYTTSFEHAGATLLRHRAGLFLAEEIRSRGDDEGALVLLEALTEASPGGQHTADLLVRRALLLDVLGRTDEAIELARAVALRFPLLGCRSATKPLATALDDRFGDRWSDLPARERAARVEAQLDGGCGHGAHAQARSLLKATDLPPGEAPFLLARVELARRRAGSALKYLAEIPRSSGRHHESRYLRAEALRRTRQRTRARKLLAEIADDAEAGDVRYRAADRLARDIADSEPARAAALMRLIAGQAPASDRRDDAIWWLGWEAWTEGRDEDAARWFGHLVSVTSGPINAARGTYWGARALERLGRLDQADLLLREALRAQPHGYYGFIAAHRLAHGGGDAPPELAAAVPPPDPLSTSSPAVLRALEPTRELMLLGLFEDAVAEVEYQAGRFPDEAAPRVLLAEAFDARGQFMASVSWLQRAFPGYRHSGVPSTYWHRLYPLPYWDAVQQSATAEALDPYLIAAVVYQESRFQATARSSAGALGLMQIMPRTGREIARGLRVRGFKTNSLYDPDRNVRFGTRYLKGLLERHDGRIVPALAAYNAGASRVRRWSKGGVGEIDEFIEAIPFRETRLYVKKILVAHAAYHRTYDGAEGACDLDL